MQCQGFQAASSCKRSSPSSCSSSSSFLAKCHFLVTILVSLKNPRVFSIPVFVCKRSCKLSLFPCNSSRNLILAMPSLLQLSNRCLIVSFCPHRQSSLSEWPNLYKYDFIQPWPSLSWKRALDCSRFVPRGICILDCSFQGKSLLQLYGL